ncbi:MAG: DsrE/DsrF/DrsH-like family protein [Planctomycetota bacterium]
MKLAQANEAGVEPVVTRDRLTMVVFSGEFDRWMAAFTLATSGAAMGAEVTMYFTFWGVLGLRKKRRLRGKSLLDRMFTLMLPKGSGATTRLNFGGLGACLFGFAMKKKHVASLDELVELARDLGVRMIVCEMSMDVTGIGADELVDGVEYGGAASCVLELTKSGTSPLFI